LREAVRLILAMWTQDEATFAGEHYQVSGAINQPKGVQQPHIPLLIAGDGEKVTLKLVAQYANACNVQGDFAALERKFAVLKHHCETIGRDYQSIHRTALTLCLIDESDEKAQALLPEGARLGFPGDVLSYGLIGTSKTIRQRLAAYEAAGVQELVIGFFDVLHRLDAVRLFAREFIQ
jgi:alkanesulfonate monooxygenase SsuD/methylene tetrahydromethanopterin reductase-like flavin-dependent oxidoreductase (luciferase family)